MEIETLKKWVEEAIQKFVEGDFDLLKLKVYEPAISHRIAVCLEKNRPRELKGKKLKFDCEYNKRRNLQKETSDGKAIRPDILVHKRDIQNDNILVIEIKKKRKSKWDEEKLKALTLPKSKGGKFEYKLGAFIYFPKDKPTVKWFTKDEPEGSKFEPI